MIIKGTVEELVTIIDWDDLHKIINVDYYNYSRIPDYEVFTIEKNENGWKMLGSTY